MSLSTGVKNKRIPRLVASTYLANHNNPPVVNHINGIKNDNRVENLEWCSVAHNNKHARENGLQLTSKGGSMKGVAHPNVKLVEEQVIEIFSLAVWSTESSYT